MYSVLCPYYDEIKHLVDYEKEYQLKYGVEAIKITIDTNYNSNYKFSNFKRKINETKKGRMNLIKN